MEILKIKGNKVPARRCDVTSLEGCDEKETAYIEKMKAKDADAIKKELTRLSDMLATAKMAADKKKWMAKRLGVLKQM